MYVFTRVRVLPEESFYAVNMRLRAIPDSRPLWRAGSVLPPCYCRAGISSLRFKTPSELSKRHASASHGKYLHIPLQTNPNPTSPTSRYLGSSHASGSSTVCRRTVKLDFRVVDYPPRITTAGWDRPP